MLAKDVAFDKLTVPTPRDVQQPHAQASSPQPAVGERPLFALISPDASVPRLKPTRDRLIGERPNDGAHRAHPALSKLTGAERPVLTTHRSEHHSRKGARAVHHSSLPT